MSKKNRPRARQEGYITIFRELDWQKRHILKRVGSRFEWTLVDDNGDPTDVIQEAKPVWTDVFITNLDWGKTPESIKYKPHGYPIERSEIIGFRPSINFNCAFIAKNLWKLAGFRKKYRVLIELKEDSGSTVDYTFEFRGVTPDDWKVSGSELLEEGISLHVEDLPFDDE